MTFCRQCGAQIPDGSAFCPSCGAGKEDNQNAYGKYNNVNGAQNSNYGTVPNDIEDNKMISILCYFSILFLIPLLMKPESQFVKFHSNQGLVLFLLGIISGVASNIPFFGWLIATVCGVFAFACFIIGIVNVCNGQMKELPLIGNIQILK